MNVNELTSESVIPALEIDRLIARMTDSRREMDYRTRDYTIDFLVALFKEGEFFINPELQRSFVWDDTRKCRFIESIFLGYPIPTMFFSDHDDGRCDIIDGAKRAATLEEFVSDDLVLTDLEKLTCLNGFSFQRLPAPIQKKFRSATLRVIALDQDTPLEVRREIFTRVNPPSQGNQTATRLKAHAGEFTNFLLECSEKPLFHKLCPISDHCKKSCEHVELVTRFFAYARDYQSFESEVDDFLDRFVARHRQRFDRAALEEEFSSTLDFVDKLFPHGFKRRPHCKFTPRPRFEAIAVGVALALREKRDLSPAVPLDWADIDSERGARFKHHTTTHAKDNKKRLAGRVEYVRDMLLHGKELNGHSL
ncbi:MAG: DUF262 domain-containing protein [Deltaproteobacteria bacterium]|jgi:hypothetical protein|nr:DUF262 domain-containing protein [Deltaproteobacteria bacterium]